MLSHNNLGNYYKNVFNMAQHHGYRIPEIENLIVYEFDVYVTMLEQYLKQKELEQQQQAVKNNWS